MKGLDQYQRLFGRARRARTVDSYSLPSPLAYLRSRCALTARVRGEWASIRCPAHKNGVEKHPSLRVSLTDGHFRCMACGASGGDIIALHRLVTGLSFLDAVRDLRGRFHA